MHKVNMHVSLQANMIWGVLTLPKNAAVMVLFDKIVEIISFLIVAFNFMVIGPHWPWAAEQGGNHLPFATPTFPTILPLKDVGQLDFAKMVHFASYLPISLTCIGPENLDCHILYGYACIFRL